MRRVMTLAVAAALIAMPVGAAHAQSSTTASTARSAADATPAPSGSASATTLRIATSGYVDSFNPFTSIYLLPTNLIRYMYESLVQNDQQDGSPTKGLADSWTTENDGKTWIFTLQDGLDREMRRARARGRGDRHVIEVGRLREVLPLLG